MSGAVSVMVSGRSALVVVGGHPDAAQARQLGERIELLLHLGQTVTLTIFMHPAGKASLTSGVLPRKAVALTQHTPQPFTPTGDFTQVIIGQGSPLGLQLSAQLLPVVLNYFPRHGGCAPFGC